MVSIAIIVFEGADELDFIGPFEVFRHAARLGAQLDASLCAIDAQLEITAAHGLAIHADRSYSGADVVLVPGGGWNEKTPRGVRYEVTRGDLPRLIAQAHAGGSIVGSICTGALALAASGIANGRRMVTHHGALEDLRSYGAQVLEQRFVDDGDIVSAGGVTSGLDLALHLVGRFADAGIARAVSREIEYPLHALL